MPRHDQTGPDGQGALTGRRMGRCTDYGSKKRNIAAVDSKLNETDLTFGRRAQGNRGRKGAGVAGGKGILRRLRGR